MEEFFLSLHKKNLELKSKHKDLAMFRPIRMYRKVLQNFILSRYKSDLITVEGRKLTIDSDQFLREMILNKYGWQAKLAKKFIQKGDTVLDLGANIGYFTCLFAELVGESGHVFSFEPEPHNFSLLKKNVEINGYKNVTLEQKAVTEKTQNVKLYLSKNPADHSIYFRTYDPRESVDIQGIALDDYFRDSKLSINYVKSNLQGADFPAVKGMSEIINKSEKMIMSLEYDPDMVYEAGLEPYEFIKTLHNQRFRVYELGICHTDNIDLKKLKEVTKKSSYNEIPSMGILCIKQ